MNAMKKITTSLALSLGLTFACGVTQAQSFSMTKLGTFQTGVFDESATEISAYDKASKRLYFTNGHDKTVDVLDLTDPANPVKIQSILLTTWGKSANSVASYGGVIAAAVEDTSGTGPGKVVLFNANDGSYLADYTVGVLPDMVAFSPDGKLIVVACEGEPNDAYTIDPEGSIGIIDVSAGMTSGVVTLLNFNAFDSQKEHLKNRGIRIFGNNGLSTVSQDLEPEYVAISADNSTAYVTLQENNAVAVVDLTSKKIIELVALGTIDHTKGLAKTSENVILNQKAASWPSLGTPVYEGNKGTVKLGGFSGLWYAADESNSSTDVFYVIPDRGPNGGTFKPDSTLAPYGKPNQNLRPFYLPNYQARLVKLMVDKNSRAVSLDSILLVAKDGSTPISGRGNIATIDEVPVTLVSASHPTVAYVDTVKDALGNPTDTLRYAALDYDPFGGDFEGVIKDKDGNFWMCDEYRPGIFKFSPTGTLIERYVAKGTAALDTISGGRAAGFYGAETLPAVYLNRRANRGFEGIAYDSTTNLIYAFIQSPLDNPSGLTRSKSSVIRILGISATDGSTQKEYVYLLENGNSASDLGGLADKIGDAVYIGNGKMLVIERDSDLNSSTGKKNIFEINLNAATNLRDGASLEALADLADTTGGKITLEMYSADDLKNVGVRAVSKRKVVNAAAAGYVVSDKTEGIAQLSDGTIVVVNDNDFGLSGAGITDDEVLGFIGFDGNAGFDPSDKDGGINIKAQPTYGFFMPDAIASYTVNGVKYFLTANEGDTRDYAGYSEEIKGGSLNLDTLVFPNHATLKTNGELGRLLCSTADGDIDGDGDIDVIHSMGTRSFSIWNENGILVFDSGDDFEQKLAADYPANFNASNSKNDFDDRSDAKGPEPEAITLGVIGGKTYAFIGLERMGGIMVYDVTDPMAPVFVHYQLDRNFAVDPSLPAAGDLGPEGIIFIDPADQPVSGQSSDGLIVVTSEVSGTVTIYGLGSIVVSTDESAIASSFSVYPSPSYGGTAYVSTYGNYEILDLSGKTVAQFTGNRFNADQLTAGVYFVNTVNGPSVKFVKQ